MNAPQRITDFHSHILPGADHGSNSLDVSLKQLKLLSAAGVEKVVATPHFYPHKDSVKSFLERRERSAKLLSSVPDAGYPQVYCGAEVLVCPGLWRMPELEKLCVEGTDVLLLEMPFTKWNEDLYETVCRIADTDMKVVMAHVGRYPTSQTERILSECNVSVQLNGEGVASFFGKRNIDKWLKRGCVAAFGSDIHGADRDAADNLLQLYRRAGDLGREITQKTNELISGAVALEFANN